jgi:hypothetical protein
MSPLNEDYAFFSDKMKPVCFPAEPPNWEAVGRQYNVPQDAVEFLTHHGSFSAYGGRLLFGDPKRFSGVLPLIFGADADFSHSDTIVIGYSAFGKLRCWHRHLDAVEIDLAASTVICRELVRPKGPTRGRDVSFHRLINFFDPDVLDVEDENGDLLFARAQKALGPLDYGQCYGFRLAPALGGRRTLDKLEKVSAPEHFSFLAQLQPFTLIDYGSTDDFGLRVIRQIG